MSSQTPVYDGTFWERRAARRAEARTLLGTLRRLEGAAARYLNAQARHPYSDHLIPMLHTVKATIREAFDKGASLRDVAGACGLTDPPALLGLTDVEAELAHRMERAS